MICVYPADCTDFSTNGNGTISPLTAEVTETLNGEYELTVVHPIDDEGKWQRLVEGCILRAPVPAATTPRVHFSAPGEAALVRWLDVGARAAHGRVAAGHRPRRAHAHAWAARRGCRR